MKLVIQILGARALIGVQDDNTDPFVEPVEATEVGVVLTAVPGIVDRAKARWATQPRGAAYVAPTPPPVPPRQPVTAGAAAARSAPAKPAEPKVGQMKSMF